MGKQTTRTVSKCALCGGFMRHSLPYQECGHTVRNVWPCENCQYDAIQEALAEDAQERELYE